VSTFAPDHATLRSLLAAAVVDERFTSIAEAIREVGPHINIDNYLGEGSDRLGRLLFDGEEAGDHLLQFHSHFSFFGNLMSDNEEASLEKSLREEGSASNATKARLLRHGALEAATLRRCPECVAQDVDSHGYGFWRTHHQIPMARHCALHACRLQTRCSSCRSPIMHSDRPLLADDPCENCGSKRFTAPRFKETEGYWATLRMMHNLLTCNVLEAKPAARQVQWLRAREYWTSRLQIRDLNVRTLEAWNCPSLKRLAGTLGCASCEGDLSLGISHEGSPPPALIAAHLATVRRFTAPI